MKSITIQCAFLFCMLHLANAQSDPRLWVSGGITYGGWADKGTKGNKFDLGPGYKFEFGQKFEGNKMALIWYSYGGYSSKNRLGESTVSTKMHQQIWELRYFWTDKKVDLYASLGMGFGAMRLSGMKGKDRYFMMPIGVGMQYVYKKTLFETYLKPYLSTGNQLGHHLGWEAGIMVGYILLN